MCVALRGADSAMLVECGAFRFHGSAVIWWEQDGYEQGFGAVRGDGFCWILADVYGCNRPV